MPKNKTNKKTPQTTFLRELLDIVVTVAVTFIVFLLLNHFVFANEVIVGESMMPTFKNSERVIALRHRSIDRKDVVILDAPDDAKGVYYIKRVIGMPGDTIQYKNDTLYVNGKKVKEPYLNAYKKMEHAQGQNLTQNFTLADINYKVKRVPKGTYFVMGDNRQNSKDSRMLGFIDKDAIEGVVSLRYWPFTRMTIF